MAWCSQRGCLHHTAQQHLQHSPRNPAITVVMSKEAASSAIMTPPGSPSSRKFQTACMQASTTLLGSVSSRGTACRSQRGKASDSLQHGPQSLTAVFSRWQNPCLCRHRQAAGHP